MSYFSNFQRGKIVEAHLAGAIVTKTFYILGVFGGTVSKVKTAWTQCSKISTARQNSAVKMK